MSENPDIASHAEDEKILGKIPKVPVQHSLRFVQRDVVLTGVENESIRAIRILQQYEWSQDLMAFGWFDVPMVDEE